MNSPHLNRRQEDDPREDRRPFSVLSIAGSDSGGGAGIQADLKTFAAHGVHGVSAITALTAQNTIGVSAIHVPPTAFLRAQLDALFGDFRIAACKIGMLATASMIEAVAAGLREHAARRIVLDPVMIASSGDALLDPDAVDALRRELLPMAALLTPNLPEAEALLGYRIGSRRQMQDAAQALLALGPAAVLLKGGHLDPAQERSDQIADILVDAHGSTEFTHPRLAVEGHGTGCTLSAAIAANLARGASTVDACRAACEYVHQGLRGASWPGRGAVAVLQHVCPPQRD